MAWVYCLQIQDSCSKGELERSAVEVLVGLIAKILAVSDMTLYVDTRAVIPVTVEFYESNPHDIWPTTDR